MPTMPALTEKRRMDGGLAPLHLVERGGGEANSSYTATTASVSPAASALMYAKIISRVR